MKSLLLFKATSIIKGELEAKNEKHQLNEELALWIEMLPLPPILHYPDISKAVGVMKPGSRGGHFYYDEKGNIRYGQKPIPHLHVVKPEEKPEQEPAKHWVEGISYDPLRTLIKNKTSENTRRAIRADLEGFFGKPIEHIGQSDFADLSMEQIINFRDKSLQEGIPHSTVARKLSTLRAITGNLLKMKEVEANPAQAVLSPKVDQISNTVGLELHEMSTLANTPDPDSLLGKRDRAILRLMLTGALRRSEPSNLNVNDISHESGKYIIKIRLGKGGKSREFILPDKTVEAITDYLSESGHTEGKLFRSHTKAGAGEGLSDKMIEKIVLKYAQEAGITKDISAHSLRHSALTAALDGGASLAEVQRMAGHSDPRMTMRYYRTSLSNAAEHIKI